MHTNGECKNTKTPKSSSATKASKSATVYCLENKRKKSLQIKVQISEKKDMKFTFYCILIFLQEGVSVSARKAENDELFLGEGGGVQESQVFRYLPRKGGSIPVFRATARGRNSASPAALQNT